MHSLQASSCEAPRVVGAGLKPRRSGVGLLDASACRFFARLGRNAISVYEAPEMGLLDKKSVKLDAVQDFSWSPADPIL
jgi:hypothetical protein